MAESDSYLQLLKKTQSNPQIKHIVDEVERFNSYAESMGVSTKKQEILRSREEMKFEIINSNWH